MRNIRDTQKNLPQLFLEFIGPRGQSVFLVAEFATLTLEIVGSSGIPVTTSRPHLLRQFIDPGADRISLGADVAHFDVEGDRPIELLEQVGLATSGEPGAHRIGILTK
jgi:hypothetical protein